MKKGLLIVGDKKETRKRLAKPFVTFVKHTEKLSSKNVEVKIIPYKDILNGELPTFISSSIEIILFFPFAYWNKNIEIYHKDKRVYGDLYFGQEYKIFLKNIEREIRNTYKEKKISFFNSPKASLLERDKKGAKRLFFKKGITTPRLFKIRSMRAVKRLLTTGKSMYVKPRFGALGKGITYISRDLWATNFRYKRGKLVSRRSDFGWRFYNIKKRRDQEALLKQLICKDFIFEEAIEHPIYRKRKFDFRVHVVYGTTPYCYARCMPESQPVSNWTQGGRIVKKHNFLHYMPRNKIKEIKELAIKTARALNLNYAGIDIVMSKDYKNIYCLEAHSFPGYEKGFDMMGYLARNILKK